MYASNLTQEQHPWWAGNARFVDLSNTFIVAHVAHAAVIMLWAGLFTLFELAVYSPDAPLYAQGLIVLPHLASEGWGIGSGGTVANTFPIFAIGVIHIVAAGVLAAGAYFHRTRLHPSLGMETGRAVNFHFSWDDPKKLGFILGHHLIVLGLAALLFVAKAMFLGGLYDTNLEEVRLVTAPTLDPGIIWSYRTHLFDVNNLEDLVGGHLYVAGLLIAGGAWHILVPPFTWVEQVFAFSADGILCYSLLGIALAGFAASYYCGFNTLAYPVEFYGPTLGLKSAFLPYYFDPNATLDQGYTSRLWLANAHFYLSFFFLQGSLWHFQRAAGFDFRAVLKIWQQHLAEARDNPALIYQNPVHLEPQMVLQALYEAPQAEGQPLLKREQRFEDYLYRRSQGVEQPSLTTINGVQETLYQTNYQATRYGFYQTPANEAAKRKFDSGTQLSEGLYGQPKPASERPAYPKPLSSVIYESA